MWRMDEYKMHLCQLPERQLSSQCNLVTHRDGQKRTKSISFPTALWCYKEWTEALLYINACQRVNGCSLPLWFAFYSWELGQNLNNRNEKRFLFTDFKLPLNKGIMKDLMFLFLRSLNYFLLRQSWINEPHAFWIPWENSILHKMQMSLDSFYWLV